MNIVMARDSPPGGKTATSERASNGSGPEDIDGGLSDVRFVSKEGEVVKSKLADVRPADRNKSFAMQNPLDTFVEHAQNSAEAQSAVRGLQDRQSVYAADVKASALHDLVGDAEAAMQQVIAEEDEDEVKQAIASLVDIKKAAKESQAMDLVEESQATRRGVSIDPVWKVKRDAYLRNIRMGMQLYKHKNRGAQSRFICVSESLDRIIWAKNQETYFLGEARGHILVKDITAVRKGRTTENFRPNFLKSNQDACW